MTHDSPAAAVGDRAKAGPGVRVALALGGGAARGLAHIGVSLRFDPVCGMVINPARARARVDHRETTYYFCSANCRGCFERDPDAYLGSPALRFGGI